MIPTNTDTTTAKNTHTNTDTRHVLELPFCQAQPKCQFSWAERAVKSNSDQPPTPSLTRVSIFQTEFASYR